MISVLHISDLHRDSGSRLSTDTLVESLRLDCERYSGDGIRRPDVAIVSGDIVLGISSDTPTADPDLNAQYDEARDFLVQLADVFFGGRRERIVLTPGNHDVSHPHVLRATEVAALPGDLEKRGLLAESLASEGTTWRWVWRTFELRRILDRKKYDDRLAPFARFYEDFYQGARTFSLDPKQQFSVHDFPELGLVIAGLSSCHDNDLFARAGRIHPDCIAGATRAISGPVGDGRIAVAVWHHNLAGAPLDSDYIDSDVLQSLIDGGFAIGLHGHQHRPQFLEHRLTADKKRGMAVISAGTLCGGPKTLPTGRRRAYNIVLIDAASSAATLHVREMTNALFSLPVWGPAFVSDFSGASITFDLKLAHRPPSSMQVSGKATELLRAGDARGAYILVTPHLGDDLARRVALEALTEIGDWAELRRVFTPPRSAPEFASLATALYELGDRSALAILLETDMAKDSSTAVRQAVSIARGRLGDRR